MYTLHVIFTFRRVVEIPKALGVSGSDTFEPLELSVVSPMSILSRKYGVAEGDVLWPQ